MEHRWREKKWRAVEVMSRKRWRKPTAEAKETGCRVGLLSSAKGTNLSGRQPTIGETSIPHQQKRERRVIQTKLSHH